MSSSISVTLFAAAIPRFLLRFARAFVSALPASFRRQWLLVTLILLYWVCAVVMGRSAGISAASMIMAYLPGTLVMTPFIIIALLIIRAIVIMVLERPQRPLHQFLNELQTSLGAPHRLAHAAPMLIGIVFVGGAFSVFKSSIPAIVPFTWDPTFEQLDRQLHGGVAPWILLQPILGYPLVTHALNWAYNFWFYFLSLFWVWQAFRQGDEELRTRFFLSLVLIWILLGNVVATVLASAGPCYFGRVTDLLDPYEPLMAYLRQVNETHSVWALGAQELLWRNYIASNVMLGGGISAMPSLHVAIGTLFALTCWRINRKLGTAMALYAVVIMIGSVHLGWHYALDGYAGALGAGAIWWVVGRCLGRSEAGNLAGGAVGIPPNIN
jgi:hypothetical protein